eukprot:TRINITY_DN18184_c0_g1_i1.p1 TRINITY_DN18184_c0_g1~~TRINITY_DN18184_c0_g1_i1.p1  ORF type:complete len:248 (-),score=35.05 TRINITY_DN18184_c0_g1_i1:363-1106(-)
MPPRRDLESGGYGYDSRAYQGLDNLSNERVREGFIRKVYATVAGQLIFTAVVAAPIVTAGDMWLQEHLHLMVCSSFGFVVLALSLTCCCTELLRKHPWNIMILALFTSLESVSLGFFCAMYEVSSVLLCFGATAVIVACLTVFSVTTKVDVTSMGRYLATASLGLFFFGLAGLWMGVQSLQMLYACGGALLMSGYIVYDTQLIAGGKHQTKRFSIDDYVLAALSLYLDLVRLFMFILRILGKRRERN